MAKKRRGRPPQEEKTPLAEKLIALRERLGLTQAEAADKIGVTARTWTSWETGSRVPAKTAKSLLRITFPGLKID